MNSCWSLWRLNQFAKTAKTAIDPGLYVSKNSGLIKGMEMLTLKRRQLSQATLVKSLFGRRSFFEEVIKNFLKSMAFSVFIGQSRFPLNSQ